MAQPVSRCGASVVRTTTSFNGAVARCLVGLARCLVGLSLCLGACEDEPAPVAAVDAAPATGAAGGDGGVDAVGVGPVPLSPFDFALGLPGLPPPMAVPPGGAVKVLRKRRPNLRASPYSKGILEEHPAEGPFRHVAYLLDRQKKAVRAVLGTLHKGYREADRASLLVDAITQRLGKPESFKEDAHEGKRWRTLDYRIDLRTDRATGDLELLFHARGADSTERPPQ